MSAKTDLPAPSEVPATIRATIRGVTYTVSELPMDRYDELLEKSTKKTRNEITGEAEEEIDQTLLLRLMVMDSVRPKIDSVSKLGVRHYRAITRLVNELHYGDEPVTRLAEGAPEAGEETPKGND
jgi:hypothetical protein